jgi:methionyl-tRNA formyltransferase
LELGLEVFQPESADEPRAVEKLREAGAELGVVAAYGDILGALLLEAARRGFLNVHPSLLPDYRGAAPVNWALMRGETVTGVSVIRMVPEMDAGPILSQREVQVGPDETAGELADRLAQVGAEVLTDVVNRLDAGEELAGRPQPEQGGFHARKLTKADGRIDWSLPARAICDRVRGLTPWPGACCRLRQGRQEQRVTVLRAEPLRQDEGTEAAAPGLVLAADEEGIVVQSGDGGVRITELKPAGGRAMDAADFIHGRRLAAGDRFE